MFSGLTISFPNTKLQPARVYKMSYRQRNYEHDYARVMFRDWDIDITRVRPGSPMIITLENKQFVGYVHDVKSHKDNNQNFSEIGFIGASYVMRQATQQLFTNVTASEVAEKMAKKYGFSFKIVPHPRVYKQISQAGLTDWEFLVKLAKQSGYFFRVTATTLYFQPLGKDFDEFITEAPVFSRVDAGFKPLNPLYSFTPIVGETLGHSGADKSATSVAGIDAETGQYFKYTKQRRNAPTRALSQPELFDRHATTVVANSYDIAKFEAASVDDRSKYAYIADAEVMGTSKVYPGSPVYIEGAGSKYDGYWTVLEVNHEIVEDNLNLYKYTTKMSLGTDSLGAATPGKYPARPNHKGVRNISPAIRNTRIKPKNIIKTPAIAVTPAKNVKLVDRINRTAPGGIAVSQATWSSDRGNLVSKPTTAGRSVAAQLKVNGYFGR